MQELTVIGYSVVISLQFGIRDHGREDSAQRLPANFKK